MSTPAKDLCLPAPDKSQLDAILQSAMSVPDHAGLTPYRFLIITCEALKDLSIVFEKAAIKRGLDEKAVLKQKQKPLRSPMIITVIANIHDNPAVPEIEQLLCAGCAAQHIQLACRSLNFGSIWLTGDNCYDLNVYQALGLDINERIIGFIYVGTQKDMDKPKKRQRATDITRYWEPSQQKSFAI